MFIKIFEIQKVAMKISDVISCNYCMRIIILLQRSTVESYIVLGCLFGPLQKDGKEKNQQLENYNLFSDLFVLCNKKCLPTFPFEGNPSHALCNSENRAIESGHAYHYLTNDAREMSENIFKIMMYMCLHNC